MNFDLARENMIESQIRPNRVTAPSILSSFQSIPREIFTPEAIRFLAYSDQALPLPQKRHMLAPLVQACFLREAQLKARDKVLCLASNTGYLCALASLIALEVHGVESNKALATASAKFLSSLHRQNVHIHHKNPFSGLQTQAPFDVIFIEGAIDHEPDHLFAQLHEKGKLISVLSIPHSHLGRLMVWTKSGDDVSQNFVMETPAYGILEFTCKKAFCFDE